MRKNSDSANEEERNRLDMVGQFHLGGFVNRFRRGCLVMRMPDSELADVPTLLYGTVDGAIGLVASLPADMYAQLSRLQVSRGWCLGWCWWGPSLCADSWQTAAMPSLVLQLCSKRAAGGWHGAVSGVLCLSSSEYLLEICQYSPPFLLYTCTVHLAHPSHTPHTYPPPIQSLQDCLRKVVKGVGGLDHAAWRSFSNERRSEEARGFLDGDLLEQLLDLGPAQQQHVAELMGDGTSAEELVRRVEELSRLH